MNDKRIYLKLQNLLFPEGDKFETQWSLFYRGERMRYDKEQGVLCIPKYHVVDFMSYLNSFSLHKWKKYTDIQEVKLHLNLRGKCCVRLVGYTLNVHNPVKTVLAEKIFAYDEPNEIVMYYPESESALLAFEIETDSDCELFEGWFEGAFSDENQRTVNLSIATTTFKKEKFIQSNLKLLQKDLLDSDDEIKDHLWIHVIDNGRTLIPEQWNSGKIKIHPNKNVGGSGGFARGMIESMEQPESITHVLLMDDDVIILPESIRRMFYLLRMLKPEFDEYFVSGAMLCYEDMSIQHEDVGFVHSNGSYGPQKNRLDHIFLRDILECDKEYLDRQYMYAGWWFCCIPMQMIKKNGLPLPLFIRGDDVEFSLRNHAKFITMNGICIWHMGFTYKFNASMELYQVHRNSLILQAVSGVCPKVNFMNRMTKLFRARMLSLDYNGAELILDAIEDFLKGPEYIMQDLGEQIMKEKSKKNEKMVDLREFPDLDIELNEVYQDPPRNFLRKWLYRITYNGHRFCFESVLKEEPGIVAYDWSYSPEHNFWHKNLLAVNPDLKTGCMRVLSKDKYRKLSKRYKSVLLKYKNTSAAVVEKYRENKDKMTSVEFWKGYLDI